MPLKSTTLRILLDDSPETRAGEDWKETEERIAGKPLVKGSIVSVGALPGGMQSGAPSVYLQVELADGTVGFCETSLALFLAAAKAFESRYISNAESN